MEDRRCFYWLYRSFLDYHAMYCVVIQNVRTALANAVFFASAQMKNKRHKPNIPTETHTIPARTQTAAHPIEVVMSDLHLNCTNYIVPSHAVSGNVPAAAATPERTTLAWFRCEVLER